MPHIHLGFAFAVTVFLHWLLIAIPLKVLAVMIHNTRIGQAIAFAV